MVASLDLARLPLGRAQQEALRIRRRGSKSSATFARLLLPIRLRSMPYPVPQLTKAYYLTIWQDMADLERFRAEAPSAWRDGRERLSLTLEPTQSFGSWLGRDPLDGHRSDPRPGPVLLITHSRTRLNSMRRFMVADAPVVRALDRQEGQLWADGFIDGIATLDTGTLSLWRDTADATRFAYGPGVHQEAVRSQRAGGWFSESWFARFSVLKAEGDWGGVGLQSLSVPANAASAGSFRPGPASV
jgi:hypothetical protein